LAVDTVVGRQQAVIKSLEGIEGGADWISGTTINGDGGISLILDVPQLIRYASREADRLEVMRA
jgi:two-component system chemotaxis sensor kinase CheA